MRANKGVALIVVLWVITLLTIMASSFALTIQRETAIVSGTKNVAKASALAEAGIHYAIVMLLSNNPEIQWQAYNSLYEVNFAGHRIRVQVTDESGKVDINRVVKEPLMEVLKSIYIEESEADSLSDAILDWRDKDDIALANGAENDQYLAAGLKYEPRNNFFSSIDELQLVIGMKPEIFRQLEDIISVHSNSVQINPANASRSVLSTLPDVDEQMIEEFLLERVESERNLEAVSHPEWFIGSNKKSNVFTIIAEAIIDDEISKQVMAVIKKSRSTTGLPYEVLKWSKDYQQPSLFQTSNDTKVVN